MCFFAMMWQENHPGKKDNLHCFLGEHWRPVLEFQWLESWSEISSFLILFIYFGIGLFYSSLTHRFKKKISLESESSVINLLTFHACLLWWKRWGCLAPRIPVFDSEICPGLCTLSSECCSSRLSYSPSCKNKEFIRMERHHPASLPESKYTQPSGLHPASATSCSWEAGEELSHSCVWEVVDLLYSYKFCSFNLHRWSCFAWAVLRWTHVGLNTSLSRPEDWRRSRHTCTENWCLLGWGIHVYNWGHEQLGLGLHKPVCLGSPGDSPKKPAVGPSLPSASMA